MIDLDAIESVHLKGDTELYLTFASWLCLGKITYDQFQKLSKWTNCYCYVLPDDREILAELSDWLYQWHRDDLYYLALLVSHIVANIPLTQQVLLLRRLSEHDC
jgi:hypothetical protein